ncbi:MAG: dihydrofolate reductase [Actinomycetota bacterium]|nr:dihydrofolate reductase [Actinomycetota bacterium]
MTVLGLIWAEAHGGVIGADGAIPWHVPEDLAHFKAVTMGAPVVMGRRTWDSLPERFRPLPGRRNIVVTRQPEWTADGAEPAGSLEAGLALAGDGEIWLIGGGELFAEAIGRADVLEVTEVDIEVDGDAYAPPVEGWSAVARDPADGWHTSRTGIPYRFRTCRRV